jgi:hypothetical protein
MTSKGKVFWNYWPWEYVTLSQKMVLQISTRVRHVEPENGIADIYDQILSIATR